MQFRSEVGQPTAGGRAHPVVSEVVLFGRPLPGDQEALRQSGRPVRAVWEARDLDHTVDLSGTTRPVAILVPKGDAWHELGQAAVEGLRATSGTQAVLTNDPSRASPETHNVIAFGNVNNNDLLARLYWSHCVFADSLWPGVGEFALRTVLDPYPWHGQGDVIVIGCSDQEGARRGVTELLERVNVDDKAMSYTVMVSNAPSVSAVEARDATLWTFKLAAESFLKTGRDVYLDQALGALDGVAESYRERDPRTLARFPITWPEEMNSDQLYAYWDALEEHPRLTEAQRLRYTRMWLTVLRGLTTRVSDWAALTRPQTVAYNHTTFPLKGIYFAARYFKHYYGLAEADDFLQRAHHCFMGQARSWKPSEDADSYLTLTTNHAIDYLLAEWDLAPLREGMYRDFAEYEIAINDSRGLNSGFGDSGIGGGPSHPGRVLPRAFWFTRDGRYLWALQHYAKLYGTTWDNPYHRDVAPVPDTEHVGLRVFPMTPGVYEYTRTHPWMGEGLKRPNVPLDAAFDKAVFRDSWAGDSTYLMLDGYGRGHHLHYDTNAITVFTDRGQRWLIDHDYLIRNTTEHNMLTVVRNGRADQSVPSCAELLSSGEGEQFAMTASRVRDYSGIDWTRSIVQVKDDCFVVAEHCVAKEADDYALDLTWKTVDMGCESLPQPGVWQVDRPGAIPVRRDVHAVADADASGGQAVVMSRSSSIWSFSVELPQGQYRMTLIAHGLDSSTDSVYVLTEDGRKTDHHLVKRAYGPSSARHDHTIPAPTLSFQRDGRQTVTVTMRERAPVRIDRVVFVDGQDRVACEIEAETAQPAVPLDAATVRGKRFWLKCADPVSARLTRHTTRGISVPLCKLWQRRALHLGEGERTDVANLLYTEAADDVRTRELRRVGRGAVLLDGGEPTLVLTRGFQFEGVASDADVVCLTHTRVAFSGGTFARLDKHTIRRAAKGYWEMALTTDTGLAAAAAVLARAQTRVPAQTGQTAEGETVADCRIAWAVATGDGQRIARLRKADLDGDGSDEILVAAGTQVLALTIQGERLWSKRFNGVCHDVHAGQADGQPGLEVIVACGDHHLYLLDQHGENLRERLMLTAQRNQHEDGTKAVSTPLTAAILNTDGTPRIFAANTNYDLVTYTPRLAETHIARNVVNHGGIDLFARDVNGDGKGEVFCTNHYGSLCCFSFQGKRVWSYYTSIGDMQAGLGDVDGDGLVEAVYGSSTGALRCLTFLRIVPFQQASRARWAFNNFGYTNNRIRLADLDNDGSDETLVASATGYLYALGTEGTPKWQIRTGVDARDVVVLDHPVFKVACVDDSGILVLSDGAGWRIERRRLPGSPKLAIAVADRMVVALANRVIAVDLGDATAGPENDAAPIPE
ncbi:MAG: PQQ-like beta-propeller repeat protein [Lentisphaerae bacterium]|nr:PQQ-like beta-propeller repeat protein [Lentisphaerota bacterium]